VPPESVLASRWRRQTKSSGDGGDDDIQRENEDVKLMQAGLIVPSHRNEALPDSVLIHSMRTRLIVEPFGGSASVCF
jgi:hypothetical protein